MAYGYFEPSNKASVARNNDAGSDAAIALAQKQALAAANKKNKNKTTKQRFEDAQAKAAKYKAKYKKTQASLDAQGLKAYPEKTPWTQTTTGKHDFKKWKKYEAEAAKYAVQLAYKSPAEQKAALNAANAAANAASSEAEAAEILASQLVVSSSSSHTPRRIDIPIAEAMVAPRMNARREHSEAQGRAKKRARRKGRPESEELAEVPPLDEYASEAEESLLEEWGTTIAAGGAVLVVIGGVGYWWTHRKPAPTP